MTSVATFNARFRHLKDDLDYNRLYEKTSKATSPAFAARGKTFLPSSTSTNLTKVKQE